MTTRANYFKIGLFVIVGFAMIFAAVMILGAGLLFRNYQYLETYFDESVQGLAIGSPVKFRGVKIGTVDRIGFCRDYYGQYAEKGNAEHERQLRYVYVRIAMDQSTLAEHSNGDIQKTLDHYADQGLRVRLASLGLTGQLYLEADYFQGEIARTVFWKKKSEHFYVPSTKSTLEALTESVSAITKNFAKIDFATLSDNLSALLQTLDSQLRDVDVAELQKDLLGVLLDVRTVLASLSGTLVDPQFKSLPENLNSVITKIGSATSGVEKILDRVSELLNKEAVNQSVAELPELMAQLRRASGRLNLLIASQHQDVSAIISNLKLFTDDLQAIGNTLEKYPAQILFGDAPAKVRD